jgi:ribose-phosphate pyrophosphokinase
VNKPMVIAMPGTDALANAIAAAVAGELTGIETRRFPDDEVYLRLQADPKGRSVVVVATLDRPDAKLLSVLFAAGAARSLGAAHIGLVAPYLPYMRQDKRFRDGEAVTSVHFADMVSAAFDWLATVDPHLHRYRSLGEVYRIPAVALQAAPLLSAWIRQHVARPLLVGPDAESEQWVSAVAARAEAPHVVLSKERFGDRDVRVSVPDLSRWAGHTPVLVDDIVSSARTMIEACRHMVAAGLPRPVCVAVHALFAGDAFQSLRQVAGRIVTTNTVPHETNAIEIAPLFGRSLLDLPREGRARGS